MPLRSGSRSAHLADRVVADRGVHHDRGHLPSPLLADLVDLHHPIADDVAYVRSRKTGELSAFVAVTLASEDYDAAPRSSADSLQEATAVFRFDRDHWETDGRTILNLSPGEAVHYFRDDLEIVSEELAHKA